VGALQLDPVEKKPFFHALPGSRALSFGMLGCDYHCGYCQNWVTSQALRDPSALARPQEITPAELVRLAHEHQARIVTSTYNEPLITSEWAVAVFREARKAGLVCSYVSNGNGTPEVLDYIKPWVSLYKVDLKSFRDRHYRELGGTLERVLWTIRALHERGFWVEIVTLLIPGFNDSDEELRDIARFLVSVSPDIPWHVTAFHKDYKMTGPDNTSVATLLRAAEIGAAEGLRFVYAGNLPGQVGRWENTYCPGCGELLIERYGFRVLRNRVAEGHCPKCTRPIPGFWRVPDSLGQVAPSP
jgi:pyruvate formate lyase activating enzyme